MTQTVLIVPSLWKCARCYIRFPARIQSLLGEHYIRSSPFLFIIVLYALYQLQSKCDTILNRSELLGKNLLLPLLLKSSCSPSPQRTAQQPRVEQVLCLLQYDETSWQNGSIVAANVQAWYQSWEAWICVYCIWYRNWFFESSLHSISDVSQPRLIKDPSRQLRSRFRSCYCRQRVSTSGCSILCWSETHSCSMLFSSRCVSVASDSHQQWWICGEVIPHEFSSSTFDDSHRTPTERLCSPSNVEMVIPLVSNTIMLCWVSYGQCWRQTSRVDYLDGTTISNDRNQCLAFNIIDAYMADGIE